MSTHHLENAALRFDKILILNQGEIAAFGAAEEVLVPQTLRRAFGGSMTLLSDDLLMLARQRERSA